HILRGGRLCVLGIGVSGSRGGHLKEDLPPGAAAGSGGARAPALRPTPIRRRPAAESRQAGGGRVTLTPDPSWQKAFFDYGTSSFADLLRQSAPHLLPHAPDLPRHARPPRPPVPHRTP